MAWKQKAAGITPGSANNDPVHCKTYQQVGDNTTNKIKIRHVKREKKTLDNIQLLYTNNNKYACVQIKMHLEEMFYLG